jgi:outer membrane immunogenic protein
VGDNCAYVENQIPVWVWLLDYTRQPLCLLNIKGYVALGALAMKRLLAGIALAALTTGSTFAADLKAPVYKAPPTLVASTPWTGFYFGAGIGFRSTQSDPTVTDVRDAFVTLAGECARFAGQFGGCFTSEPANDTAFRVSPYFGFNWQFAPQWVAGVEGDFGFAKKTTTIFGMFYPESVFGWSGEAGDTFSVKTTWDASARGRIGYLVTPTVLAYATGGAAWLHIETTSNCNTNGLCRSALLFSPPVITDSTTRLGWTIGGGIEAALWSNWIARAEYRYADFGTITNTDFRAGSPSVGGFPLAVTYNLALKTHTATFGLAYKFN